MSSEQKTNLLSNFLENYDIEGICNYFIIEDPLQIVLVFDRVNWWEEGTKNPLRSKLIIMNLKSEIKNFLGLNVYIGMTVKDCLENNPLNESKSIEVKSLDKLIYPTLKDIFSNAQYDTRLYTNDSVEWTGFWVNEGGEDDTLLVGKPFQDSETFWYTNGKFFEGYPEMFGVEYPIFFEAIARFIKKEFKIDVNPIL